VARRHLHHPVFLREELDLLWLHLIQSVAMPQLSILSIAPPKHSSLTTKGKSVLPATDNLMNVGFYERLDRRGSGDVLRVAVAELAEDAPAPCEDHAFLRNGSGMVIAA